MSSEDELLQILQLQRSNLPTAINLSEKKEEGFVTVQHDLPLLTRMNKACAHVIAKDDDKVVGYTLCMTKAFGQEIEVLKPMFKKIDEQLTQQDRYIVMGQVCIDKAYRRQGIFRGLYNHMSTVLKDNYDLIVTEVDADNTRSMQAHYAVGFELLLDYRADHHDWSLITLKTS